ncbi:MAG TPA: phosphoribosylpyrophosphate synthetase [Bacteroidia bacterium]|jgi:hypothetical protein|nr:phosphoribosylpyrophosphate synthetase [Bacteroidia bacterium]
MKNYDTLSEALTDLTKRGYDHDFNIEKEFLICHKNNMRLANHQFEIDEVYRFEGETDPGDESIVYAISSPHLGVKGVLVNAFGKDADAESAALVAKLKNHKK